VKLARAAIAAVAVAIAWTSVLLAYYWIAPFAGEHDRALIRIWTGGYAAVAFLTVALPLALSRKALSLPRIVLRGMIAGAGLTLLPPALYLFPWTFIAGALGGTLAALTYGCFVALLDDRST
jgi:hypothetical protein